MMMKLRMVAASGLVALAAACGGGDADQQAGEQPDTSQAASDTSMQTMPGMGMESGGTTGMMTQMQSHIEMIKGVSADSMAAMMPQHRQMVANMLAQMNRDMREMNMPGDTAWTATVDSLRQDLTRLPEMSAQEMHSLMPQHQRRVMRLIEMHRKMMGI